MRAQLDTAKSEKDDLTRRLQAVKDAAKQVADATTRRCIQPASETHAGVDMLSCQLGGNAIYHEYSKGAVRRILRVCGAS